MKENRSVSCTNWDAQKGGLLCDVAGAKARAGDFAGAKALINDVREEVIKSFGLLEIAVAETKAGDAAGAKSTASTIVVPNVKAPALSEIFAAHLRSGDQAGASETLAQATAAADAAVSFEQADAFCTLSATKAPSATTRTKVF